MGERCDYAQEFKSPDFTALKKDLAALMTVARSGSARRVHLGGAGRPGNRRRWAFGEFGSMT
jgi:hypothetical protein